MSAKELFERFGIYDCYDVTRRCKLSEVLGEKRTSLASDRKFIRGLADLQRVVARNPNVKAKTTQVYVRDDMDAASKGNRNGGLEYETRSFLCVKVEAILHPQAIMGQAGKDMPKVIGGVVRCWPPPRDWLKRNWKSGGKECSESLLLTSRYEKLVAESTRANGDDGPDEPPNDEVIVKPDEGSKPSAGKGVPDGPPNDEVGGEHPGWQEETPLPTAAEVNLGVCERAWKLRQSGTAWGAIEQKLRLRDANGMTAVRCVRRWESR